MMKSTNLDLLKTTYQWYHSKKHDYMEEMQVRLTIDSLYRNLSKEEQKEFSKWEQLEIRIQNKSFPELA